MIETRESSDDTPSAENNTTEELPTPSPAFIRHESKTLLTYQSSDSEDPSAGSTKSVVFAIANFVNMIIGAGILVLPFALKQCGFWAGVVMIAFSAFLNLYTVRLHVRTALKLNCSDYEEMAEKLFGPAGFYVVSLLILILALGLNAAYFVVVGDTIPKVLEVFLPGHRVAQRDMAVVLTGLIIVLPLCLLRDVSKLGFSSALSLCSIVVVFAVILVQATSEAKSRGISAEMVRANGEDPFPIIKPSIFSGMGVTALTFLCQHGAFCIHKSVKNPTLKTWNVVSGVSLMASLVPSMTVALVGYGAFMTYTEGNILESFKSSNNGFLTTARGLLGLTMMFTIPIENFFARSMVMGIIKRFYAKPPTWLFDLVGVLCWVVPYAIGIVVKDLGDPVSLIGCLAGAPLGFIFPAVFYLKAKTAKSGFAGAMDEIRTAWKSTDLSINEKLRVTLMYTFPVFVIIFGTVVFFAGSISVFLSSDEPQAIVIKGTPGRVVA